MKKFMTMFAMLVMTMLCFAHSNVQHTLFRDYELTTMRSYSLNDDTHVYVREYVTENGNDYYLYLTKGDNDVLIPYNELLSIQTFLKRSVEPLNGAYYMEDRYDIRSNDTEHTIGYYTETKGCFQGKSKTKFFFNSTIYTKTSNCCCGVVKSKKINWFSSKNKKRINKLCLMIDDAIKKINELK